MPLMLPSAAARSRAGLGLLVALEQQEFHVARDTGVIGRFGLLDVSGAIVPASRTGNGFAEDSEDSEWEDDDDKEDGGGGAVLLSIKGTEMEAQLSRAAGTLLVVELKNGGMGKKLEQQEGAKAVVEHVIDVVEISKTRSCLDTLHEMVVKKGEGSDDDDLGSDSDISPVGRRRSSSTTLSSHGKAGRGHGRGRGRRGGKTAASKAKKKKKGPTNRKTKSKAGRGLGRGPSGSKTGAGKGKAPAKKKAAKTVSLVDLARKAA